MAGVGFAIAGTVLAAAGVTQSFVQAGKQNKLRREAENEAAKTLKETEKLFEENKLKGLSLPKEVFERQREANLASGEQALRAAAEAEGRGAAATAGRVQMAQQEGQRNISTDQADRLLKLQMMGAKEDARLQTGLANLKLAGVQGAQQAARDAQMAQMQAVQQGFEGLKNLGGTVVDYKNELIPLFQNKGPDFSSVGGNMVSQNAIAANPTLYGQYQGQNVFLPDVFGDGLNFTNPIQDQVSSIPQLTPLAPRNK